MKREPLVTLPPALIAPGADHGRALRDGRRRRRHQDARGGARPGRAHAPPRPRRIEQPGRRRVAAATDSLLKATDEAIGRAGIAREQLDAAVLAVAGTDTEAVAAHVRESSPETWVVVNDVVGAWATATGAQPGVGAISGTGSNVFGVGSTARRGGPAAGVTCSATRAAATGWRCSRSGPPCATASARDPRPR